MQRVDASSNLAYRSAPFQLGTQRSTMGVLSCWAALAPGGAVNSDGDGEGLAARTLRWQYFVMMRVLLTKLTYTQATHQAVF